MATWITDATHDAIVAWARAKGLPAGRLRLGHDPLNRRLLIMFYTEDGSEAEHTLYVDERDLARQNIFGGSGVVFSDFRATEILDRAWSQSILTAKTNALAKLLTANPKIPDGTESKERPRRRILRKPKPEPADGKTD